MSHFDVSNGRKEQSLTNPQIVAFLLAGTFTADTFTLACTGCAARRAARQEHIGSAAAIFGSVGTGEIARIIVWHWTIKDGVRLHPDRSVAHRRFGIRVRFRLVHTFGGEKKDNFLSPRRSRRKIKKIVSLGLTKLSNGLIDSHIVRYHVIVDQKL